MATDYDAPRKTDEDIEAESLELLQATSKTKDTQSPIDVDEANVGDDMELPGADLSGETLTVTVVPIQRDEFTCTRCFLVRHHTQRAPGTPDMCIDCAA